MSRDFALDCSCGHSQAAHLSSRGCAFCHCTEFAFESGAPPPREQEPPDEVKQAIMKLWEHPAFAGISPGELQELARQGRKRTILSGTVLMDKGDDSDRLYLLLKGSVGVERPAAGLIPELSATLGPGDIVGEVGFLHGATHSAVVTAWDDLHVLEFSRQDVRAVLKEHDELRLAFMRMVHHRLGSAAREG